MKQRFLIVILLGLFLIAGSIPAVAHEDEDNTDLHEIDGEIIEDEYPNHSIFGNGVYELYWRIENDIIYMAMVGKTTGWVAIGFGPITLHKGADVVSGWVDENKTVSVIDCYFPDMYPPHPHDTEQNGTYDILSYNGTEHDNKTIIEFSRKLSTGDDFDTDIPLNNSLEIFWSTGPTDNWRQKHEEAGYTTVNFTAGEHSEKVVDWIGHAIVSIIGLILAISILISGAKLTGRIKGKKGANTYKIHKIVSVLFSVFMIGTFFYGLWVTSGHGSPILSSVHGWLGLIIFIFAVIQLIPCLFVKNRTRIKFPHMIIGYPLAFLVVIQVAWGTHIAVLGEVKSLVLIHSITGGIAALALFWIIIEMRHLTEKGIKRSKNASYISAFFNIVGCWIIGGYSYLTEYGSNVKPIIKSGAQPWAHQIITETKEHIFIFLPILSILLAITLFTLGKDDTLLKDLKSKRAVILLTAFVLFFILLMFIMGAIISYVGNLSAGGI